MMGSTIAGLFLHRYLPPVLGAVAFIALALWVGVLFSVSWLCGRARWSADGSEPGKLAESLGRRWATPSLVVSIASGLLWIGTMPTIIPVGEVWRVGLGCALGAMLVVHFSVSMRARRVASGNVQATQGEAARRFALVLSLTALTMLIGFYVVRP
jgi:hypothetical protein